MGPATVLHKQTSVVIHLSLRPIDHNTDLLQLDFTKVAGASAFVRYHAGQDGI